MRSRVWIWGATFLCCLLGWAGAASAQSTSCVKPNVLIVFNQSSTMGGSNWNQARVALAQLVQSRNQNTRFGLVMFSSTARVAVTIRDNALTAMVPIFLQAQPSGAGNHKRAIATARTYLIGEIGRDSEASRSYSIVLVTDGRSDDGDIASDLAALRTLTTPNGQPKDVRTYVLGVSSGANTTAMGQWAASGGTSRYFPTSQVSTLSSFLQQNEPQPRPEQCDGQDNDCDGQTDENLQRSCLAPCPGGNTTAAGTQSCQNGSWSTCLVQRRPESCNGRDDDCNGQVDDNLQPLSCQTRCGAGTMTCTNGRWVNCTAPQPQVEVCDGKDNDCDGEIDERCPCKPGDTRACGSTTGECSQGTQSCQGGQWSPICTGEQGPRGEQCDNKDNDCDGLVDDNVRRVCSNQCGRGVETCTAGKWGGCTAPTPKTETCNGTDDDCDGIIDEGCACQPGQTRPCGTNTGACRQGINVCLNGTWSTTCLNSQGPTPETCDRIDNDCDGLIDDNLTRPCTNPCGTGTERCSFGRWIGCNAPTPQNEVCDGKDNDCDGQVDEGIQRNCYTGPAGTQGVGACKAGTQTCTAGKWSMCTGEVLPAKEACDKVDNDCNGQIDEGCSCQPGTTQSCGLSVGACKTGTQTCVAGVWGACIGDVKPTKEDCNGQDDDCDGQTDESLSRSCSNGCGAGTESCIGGQWRNCSAPTPRPEVCGDNQDNDCDGQIDETCPCRPGQTRACGSSVGVCKPGVQECVNGIWSDACKGGVTASKEICDNLDNDCNGQVDDGISCACQNGAVRPCYSGPPNTAGVGLCKTGTQRCTNNQWSACLGEVLPTQEICDNLDNNCDGTRDEKVSQACQTPCGVGVQTCSAGTFGPCSAPPPRPEICGNNIDDDCDGDIDETCPCKTGETRPCGASDVGACKKGVETCVASKWSGVCVGEVKPTTEICDGIDNNCDGQVDNSPLCACKDGENRACYNGPAGTVGVGICKAGQQICRGGQWGPCAGQTLPTREQCDGQDNNCDGSVDEGLSRACASPCGPGTQRCVGGTFGPCSTPPPTPEVCDGQDNDCNGTVDDGAPCPPNSACLNGQCVVQDGGNADVQPPECTTDADCPSGFVCRERRCLEDVRPDIAPDISPDVTPDVSPDVTPDTTPPIRTCTTNLDCGVGNVCRWGRCHKACSQNADCPGGQAGTCQGGLCVPQCVADKHCPSGMVCRSGWCRNGCRSDADCSDGKACVGFACAETCTSDTDCASAGSHCLDGKSCVPNCNLAADCPPGFACNAGKCVEACSSFDQSRNCSETQVCSAGQCTDNCEKQSCSSAGNFECKDKVCVQKCSSDADCKTNEACIVASCVPRCSIQDDCPGGTRCHEGICFPSCSSDQDCGTGRACLSGRCVDACTSSSPGPTPTPDAGSPDLGAPVPAPPPVDAGQDAGPGPDVIPPDTGTPDPTQPDNGSQSQCASNALVCAGDTCHVNCIDAASCKTGYVCSTASDTSTDKVCLPPCRVDVDCPSNFFCHRGVCRLGCQNDAQCDSGETCSSGRCVRTCQADTDCPLPQSCKEGVCKTPDPQEKDRGDVGGTIPKMKLAGGCGCQATHQNNSWLVLLLLSLLLIPVLRRKRA